MRRALSEAKIGITRSYKIISCARSAGSFVNIFCTRSHANGPQHDANRCKCPRRGAGEFLLLLGIWLTWFGRSLSDGGPHIARACGVEHWILRTRSKNPANGINLLVPGVLLRTVTRTEAAEAELAARSSHCCRSNVDFTGSRSESFVLTGSRMN